MRVSVAVAAAASRRWDSLKNNCWFCGRGELSDLSSAASARAAAGETLELDTPHNATGRSCYTPVSLRFSRTRCEDQYAWIALLRCKPPHGLGAFSHVGRPLPQRLSHYQKLSLSLAPPPPLHPVSHARCSQLQIAYLSPFSRFRSPLRATCP